jgi:hypothetical protein
MNMRDMLRRLWAPACLVLACMVLFAVLHVLQGSNPLTPSAYNSYTLQAMQWRKGRIALDHDVPHLELAIYRDQFWVSFPPVPTVPVYLLTFLFGSRVPDTLLVQLYAVVTCLAVYALMRRSSASKAHALAFAFLFCFGSSFLPLLQNGAVWYQAQALALLLTVLAIERMQAGSPTISLVLYALSVGCRPFNVLFGPVLMLMYWLERPGQPPRVRIKALLPGVLLGLLVAGAYAAYNVVRFGHPLEFGHNYLPEFSFQGGTQFSLKHIGKNINTFVLGWPWDKTPQGLQLKQFGFSLLLANPIFLCLLLWAVRDGLRREGTTMAYLSLALACVHLLLLLSHRTVGGYQYGARYAVDAMPWALCYLWARKGSRLPLRYVTYLLLVIGLLMAFWGATVIYLPF